MMEIMRVIQGILKKWNLSSHRLNDKRCNKADLQSLKNCSRRDICELHEHQ